MEKITEVITDSGSNFVKAFVLFAEKSPTEDRSTDSDSGSNVDDPDEDETDSNDEQQMEDVVIFEGLNSKLIRVMKNTSPYHHTGAVFSILSI